LRQTLNRRQTMTLPRPITGVIHNTQRGPGIKLMARGRPIGINTAPHPLPDLSGQSHTTRGCLISTFHPHELGCKHDSHLWWNTPALRSLGQLCGVKVHAIRRAASATAFTDGEH
jgi:hypothetical protein